MHAANVLALAWLHNIVACFNRSLAGAKIVHGVDVFRPDREVDEPRRRVLVKSELSRLRISDGADQNCCTGSSQVPVLFCTGVPGYYLGPEATVNLPKFHGSPAVPCICLLLPSTPTLQVSLLGQVPSGHC